MNKKQELGNKIIRLVIALENGTDFDKNEAVKTLLAVNTMLTKMDTMEGTMEMLLKSMKEVI